MTFATGVGSMPGDDQAAFDRAVRVVLDELPQLAHLPEVPGRGATASMTGRALAVVAELGADLQPAGWRLTDAPGIDQRRARSLFAQDLDTLEEAAEGYAGAFKVQMAGPWTLAATVERPRGDKILADHGARRELAQALAEGLRDHVRDLRRRLPGVDRLVVQVDEPALAAVLAGAVPTASGFGRHRTVDSPEASDTLGWVLGAIADEGAEPWVHSCASGTPLDLLRGAGARGLSVDLGQQGPGDHDVLAAALEAGESVVLGVVPSTDGEIGEAEVVERVLRWFDLVGLEPVTVGNFLGISGTCGLAGASHEWARRALQISQRVAAELTD
ncbi:MAG TPA: methionine synthase [Nocardioides sp.]|nr:methionine synthase [Nocardioides sp.]